MEDHVMSKRSLRFPWSIQDEKLGKQLDKSLVPTEERCEKQIDICGSSTMDGEGAPGAVHMGDHRQNTQQEECTCYY